MQVYSAEEEYPDLENHNSHMAHCLTEDIYKKIKDSETSSGFTIDNVIQCGIDNPGNIFSMDLGCIAGDEESYEIFSDFFDSVIEVRHNGYKKTDIQKFNHDSRMLNGGSFSTSVLACRIRGVRNIKGFCLPPHNTRAERRKIERIIKEVCTKLSDGYKGKYIQIKDLSAEQCENFLEGLSKDQPSSLSKLPHCTLRDWPDARGVFFNEKNDFVIKANIQDHLDVAVIQHNGDLKKAFTRWSHGIEQLERILKENGQAFMKNEHLGYISSCPSNLGTGLIVSVKISLPKLTNHFRIEEVIRRLHLEKNERAENTNSQDSMIEVSNIDRLGVTEIEILQSFINSVQFLQNCEEKLRRGESIEKDINQMPHK